MEQNKTKSLGFWMLTALVTGNMIGSGVFLLPASLASFGTIGILSWILTACGAILLALVFAKLSQLMPRVGGPYAFCRDAFGDFIGFTVAYNYWIALWIGNAAIVVAFVGYLSVFFPALTQNHWLAYWVSLATVWILTGVNIIGVRSAGILQLLTTILKLCPLILIGTLGLFYINPSNLAVFNVTGHSTMSALTGAASLTLWAFIGVESATVPADSVVDPKKNIPRATIVGTLIAALVYILSTTAVMGIVPLDELAKSSAPYALAAQLIFGTWGQIIVAIGAIISCFGALNGWILLQGQVPMAAARDGLFPQAFAKVSRNGTPIFGLVVSAALISLLLLLTIHDSLVKQFTFIILLAVFATLVPYLLSTMAELLIFIKCDKFRQQIGLSTVVIAIAAFMYSFWMIIGSGEVIVFYGVLLLFSATPVYVWIKWRAMAANSGMGDDEKKTALTD